MGHLNKDRWIGIGLAAAGLIMCFLTGGITTTGQATANDIGSKFFPYLASGGLTLCGAGVFATGRKTEEKQEAFMPKAGYKRMGILLAVMMAYVVLLSYIGFIAASPIMLFFVINLLAGEKRPKFLVSVAFSVVMTAVIYVFFVHVLNILLPPFRLL